MHVSLAVAVLAMLGAGPHALAANQSTSSNTSVSLSQAVGGTVASALAPAKLVQSGWSWSLAARSSSASSSPASSLRRRSGAPSAEDWAKANLNLYNGRFSSNPGNLIWASDPTVPSGTGSGSIGGDNQVLSVTYAAGSYGLLTGPSGGTAFFSQPFLSSSGGVSGNATPYVLASKGASQQANTSSPSRPQLLLAYSVYFPQDFDFVRGGKLPGLYSSVGSTTNQTGAIDASTSGCQGGSLDGTGISCWSARVMWLESGQGELNLYLPQSLGGGYNVCTSPQRANISGDSIICNSDFSLSMGRGAFTFRKGSWNDLALYVQINTPDVANGKVELFVNRAASPAIQVDGLIFRSATIDAGDGLASSTSSAVVTGKPPIPGLNRRDMWDANNETWVDKIMFTSFFGGSSSSEATPNDTQAYFKNVAFFAGQSFSSERGRSFTISLAPRLSPPIAVTAATLTLTAVLGILL